MYGEGSVTGGTCQKWCMKFHTGYLSLDDAPQSGRPVEVDSDQIETLNENNQCYTLWEIANTCKISKSIKLLVERKNMSFILWKKKTYGLFGQPKTRLLFKPPSESYCYANLSKYTQSHQAFIFMSYTLENKC